MGLTGWAIYDTACKLVGGIGNSPVQFNATLFHYFLIFTGLGVLISTVLHYYLTKKLMMPINQLIDSTKVLQHGSYPEPIELKSSDEIAELIQQYNELIYRLEENESERKKLIENISHELRTPTANIKGYLYALKEGDIAGDEQLFQSLHSQAEQLTDLIAQVDRLHLWDDSWARSENEKEYINSKQLIEDSLQLFDWQIKQEAIDIDTEIEDVQLLINKHDLQQVIANLIDNAIRYRSKESPIFILGYSNKDTYTIKVMNEGKPLSEVEQGQLFNRFYRVDSSRNRKTGGSGLGLAIAKEIMMQHDGSISYETRQNKHTFVINIPFYQE